MDIFCKIIEGEIPSNTCYEDDIVKCIMDANPMAPGHLLIIPKKHYTTILDIDDDVYLHIKKVADMLIKRMEERLPNLDGVRVLVNYGVPQAVKHFHMHIVPVYNVEPDKTQEEVCDILK